MRDVNTSKATGIDRLPGRFLKDGVNALAKAVTDICNLSISLNIFESAFKLAKVKPIFKKGQKNQCLKLSTYFDLFPYCQYFRRSLKKLFKNKQLNF